MRVTTPMRKSSSCWPGSRSLWPDPDLRRAEKSARDGRPGRSLHARDAWSDDAFAASLDAGSGLTGEEGLFYVWREDEIDAVMLGDAGWRRFKAMAYTSRVQGNWKRWTVLRRIYEDYGSPDDRKC